MTKVNFYLLDKNKADRLYFTCKITEKAWVNQHRVFIHTENKAQAEQINQLLWTFRATSFIPHDLLSLADQAINPILIGYGTDAGDETDILINLAPEIPTFFSQFERLITPINEQNKSLVRKHYIFYRDCGYPLKTYDLNK